MGHFQTWMEWRWSGMTVQEINESICGYEDMKLYEKEKDIVKAILQYINVVYRKGHVWRNNVGATTFTSPDGNREKKFFVRFAEKGQADIIGYTNEGFFIAIEVKAPGKKRTITEEQEAFLSGVRQAGGLAILADCLEDVISALDKWKGAEEP